MGWMEVYETNMVVYEKWLTWYPFFYPWPLIMLFHTDSELLLWLSLANVTQADAWKVESTLGPLWPYLRSFWSPKWACWVSREGSSSHPRGPSWLCANHWICEWGHPRPPSLCQVNPNQKNPPARESMNLSESWEIIKVYSYRGLGVVCYAAKAKQSNDLFPLQILVSVYWQ